jgi:hypothetical protein
MAEDKGVKAANIASAILTVLPSVVSMIQAIFVKQNPGVPPPTSAEVLLGFNAACASSLAVDDDWLNAHPKT